MMSRTKKLKTDQAGDGKPIDLDAVMAGLELA